MGDIEGVRFARDFLDIGIEAAGTTHTDFVAKHDVGQQDLIMKPEIVVLSGGIPKFCNLIVEHWFFFFCLHRHTCGGKRHTINRLWIGFFEVYRHILSWCRHSEFRILFFLLMFLFLASLRHTH